MLIIICIIIKKMFDYIINPLVDKKCQKIVKKDCVLIPKVLNSILQIEEAETWDSARKVTFQSIV